MSFLLDTNVVSEWVKPRPDPGVVQWLAEVDEDRAFLSVVTLAEIRRGIERLPHGHRRRRLEDWLLVELPLRFEGRVLPIDRAIADRWGLVVARSEAAGRPIGVIDAFLAATAIVQDLMLVTRNQDDFIGAVDETINPWSPAQ
ncbi:MAG TPA: type II toxin-antitoxin system VapC family toxin [Hyphomicrobiales bacterium]|nr:type II toxin-antitoxin system VapC family toxin [Hyphomicrobiales bacterium]